MENLPDIGNMMVAAVNGLRTARDILSSSPEKDDGTVLRILEDTLETMRDTQPTLMASVHTYEARVRELEKELAGFRNWNARKSNYRLVTIRGTTVYESIGEAGDSDREKHYVCATCSEKGEISYLERVQPPLDQLKQFECPNCPNQLSR